MNPRRWNNYVAQENWRNQLKSKFDKTFAEVEINRKFWKEKEVLAFRKKLPLTYSFEFYGYQNVVA